MLTNNTYIDDEVLIIEDGGEMPEVTMHGCLYFLCLDPEGPQCSVSPQDLLRLKWAVVAGYRRIIVRDLTLENRGKGHYRGLARSAINWQRLCRFGQREGLDLSAVAAEVCALLVRFMVTEYQEVERGMRTTCINCSAVELAAFFAQIGFDPSPHLPDGWQGVVCCG